MLQMKKKMWKCAIAMGAMGLIGLPGLASAASVEEVLDKYIEVTGGQAAHEAITSMLVKAFFPG